VIPAQALRSDRGARARGKNRRCGRDIGGRGIQNAPMARPSGPAGTTIQRLFADVAPGYDRANRLLSLGIDRRWRRRAVAIAGVRPGERALDVCAGTGDLAWLLARAGACVVATDFCAPMLVRAVRKGGALRGSSAPHWALADSQRLPFADGSFDLCTVAFGIRNVEDPLLGLRELARVTRPGGRVVVLEFCRPRTPVLAGVYRFYFHAVLPRLGRLVAGAKSDAYSYLPASVETFPERQQFCDLMRAAGLVRPQATILSCGIAAVYRGELDA
jgi:demethylmenaquinone methyltransferase/2-methoxy-6-polyprenyl-1,4-benzoquinol methylase